ncbi:MAG: replicative DNA helicase [bacterium]|nr:replicative DNA helicase [bacterium]MDY2830342.1 replicative DNA helicase [Alphaproteobacteria bacterium]
MDTTLKPEQLPKNIEAEQALLGAILANNKTFEKVSEFLRPEHFADPIHAKIFDIISKLITRGHVADTVTLKNYFEQDGSLDEVGGYKYLIKLADSATPLTNAEYYAQFIYDKYLRRELIATGFEIANNAAKEDLDSDASEQIENAEKRLFDLANQGESSTGFIEFSTALTDSVKRIESAYQKDGKISGLPTGLDALDAITGGLNDSDLIIIAGRPAMGKTALATNIAYNVADFLAHDKNTPAKNKGVAFFSLEMSADQLASRILSTVTQTNGHKMRTGELETAEFTRIAAAVRELEQIPLYIDDTPGLNINTIRTRARRLKRNKGLGLIVIDYIQLINGTGSKRSEGNRVQELSEISRGLKILAKELQVPVIALSQLNRGVESRDDKRPLMSDLRESGSIEQDADIVMFVFRENYYIKNEEPKPKAGELPEHLQKRLDDWKARLAATQNIAEVIIGKQRHGPTGTVQLFWNGDYAQFGNLAKQEYLPEQIGN